MGGCFNYKEETKEEFLETLRGYLRRVDGYMGDRPYLVSTAGPTWIDFRFLEFVSLMKNVDGDFLTREFPKFNEYRNRMLALDGVQAAYDRYKGMTYVPSFAGLCPLDS